MRRVITYGTYDLLHYGHINLLRRAKQYGDYLIVALSTDEFNWEQKHNGQKAESGQLYIKTITVDPAGMLKRLRPAPQGRGYRIRKRSNHVTIVVDSYNNNEA